MIAKAVPIALAAVCALALAGAKCTTEEVTYYENLILGTSPAPQAAALYIAPSVEAVVEDSSSEEVVTVAVVEAAVVPEPSVEPEPPPLVAYEVCEPYEWRGNIVPNCHWEWR
jgi:hypothetical protein